MWSLTWEAHGHRLRRHLQMPFEGSFGTGLRDGPRRFKVSNLERRLERQILTIEDASPALRRRVAQRVAELETAIDERRSRLRDLAAQAAPEARQAADVAAILDRRQLDSGRPQRVAPRPNSGRCSRAFSRQNLPARHPRARRRAGAARQRHGAGSFAGLVKGELRAMVLAHLQAHPGEAFTPTAVAAALGRSAGQ